MGTTENMTLSELAPRTGGMHTSAEGSGAPELEARHTPCTRQAPSALELADARLLEPIAQVFAQTRARYPGVLPCARGCSQCCVSFFEINVLDVWRMLLGLSKMPLEEVQVLQRRARQTLDGLLQGPLVDWKPPYDLADLSVEALQALQAGMSASCPALDEAGACGIYAHRPRICRLQGLAYRDPAGGAELEDYCAEVFGDPAYRALPAQPLDLYGQWELEARLRSQARDALPFAAASGHRSLVAATLLLFEVHPVSSPPATGSRSEILEPRPGSADPMQGNPDGPDPRRG